MATVTYYDSIDDAVGMLSHRRSIHHLSSWAGAETRDQFNDLLLYGDAERGEQIRNMIDRYQLNIKTVGPRQQLDVAGSMPSIPHMLGGDPMHMRRRKPETMNRGRIRMFVNIVVSAGISDRKLMARGSAIAALAYNLSTIRPVELWAIGTMNEPRDSDQRAGNYNIPCIRIAANPLDPQRVASILAHPVGPRALMFNLRSDSDDSWVQWAWDDFQVQQDAVKFKERLTPILGLSEDDLVFPGGMLGDVSANPGKWLKDKMLQLGLIDKEGESNE